MACGMHDCVSTGRGCNDALFALTLDVSDLLETHRERKSCRTRQLEAAAANRERAWAGGGC